jgi:exonuclease III
MRSASLPFGGIGARLRGRPRRRRPEGCRVGIPCPELLSVPIPSRVVPAPAALVGVAAFTLCQFLATGAAHAQLRILNWNVATVNGDPNAIRDVLAMAAEDDLSGFAVVPAILVFQEVKADDINVLEGLVDAAIPGVNYTRGTYTTSTSEDSAGGAQAVFYRNTVVTELTATHIDLDTGAGRKSDRWQFQLVGYSSTAARFYIYSSHLKAGTGSTNENERLSGAQTIRNSSDSLPQGTHILYCGDFNVYSNNEPAYVEFLSLGNGQGLDPLGSGSWGGVGNAIKHTQSPRDIAADGLTGGGMDDRFDFQLTTSEFQDSNGLSIVMGSYRSFGNDGNHYNLAINDGSNSYYPGDIATSNLLADLLFNASDHIPVIVDYQVPGVLSAVMSPNFGKVIQGASVTVPALVQNIAAGHPLAIDSLDVQVTGTGSLSGSGVTVAPLAPSFGSVALAVNTAQVGFVSGGATVTALSEAAQNANFLLTTGGQVVRASNASLSASADVDATTVTVTDTVGATTVGLTANVHNLGYDLSQALLDIDLIGGLGNGFALVSGIESGIGSTPASLQFSFNATGKPAGEYSKTVTVSVSDEDIPGSGSTQLSLTLTVILETAGNPADLDGNGTVDGADLAVLLGQWGGPGSADLDGSGVVDGADLAMVLGAWM